MLLQLLGYLSVTVRVAEPPRLLRTVILCGLLVTENSPRPAESVPIRVLVDVEYTRKVAPAAELVASTRKMRFAPSYCALEMDTVSALVDAAVTVSVAERLTPA